MNIHHIPIKTILAALAVATIPVTALAVPGSSPAPQTVSTTGV
jgi:hypothetical protein